jgi:phenylacetic acid degradation operon negative regulatory protein
MPPNWFHHPDISIPVISRRVTSELIDALAWYGDLIISRGRSAWRNQSYSSSTAYLGAVRRLKKRGILAISHRKGREPILRLSPSDANDRAVHSPDRWWNSKWNGVWYVIVYDVPEHNRRYRDHLRKILLRNRCGYLQNSVWISPRDLRPLFDELETAASLGHMAHLFEARTVLGHGPQQIVSESWDFDRINEAHARFQRDIQAALKSIPSLSHDAITAVIREELRAFREVIQLDPLLPRRLHPPGYTGPQSFRDHQLFVKAVRRHGNAF